MKANHIIILQALMSHHITEITRLLSNNIALLQKEYAIFKKALNIIIYS